VDLIKYPDRPTIFTWQDMVSFDFEEWPRLQPDSAWTKADHLCLKAKLDERLWSIDLVPDGNSWKLDWFAGHGSKPSRQERMKRLIARMDKHTTDHFVIHYFKGSTAEKELAQIAAQREKGFREICRFLGRKGRKGDILLFRMLR